jgi:ABC-type multidrug transport system fused ATPase/permease subunit
MRGRGGGLWGRHGSADEVEFELTGREWLRIFSYFNQRWLYIVATGVQLATSSTDYLLAIVQGRLATVLVETDYPTAQEFMDRVNVVCAEMIGVIALIFILNLINAFLASASYPSLLRDLRLAVMKALQSQDAPYFDEHQTGVILSRLADDVTNAHEAYSVQLVECGRLLFQWFTRLGVCMLQSWQATLFLMAGMPLFAGSQWLGNGFVDRLWLSFNERSTHVSAKAEEILTSFRIVRANDAELREYRSYKNKLMDVHTVVQQTAKIHGVKEFVSTLIHWGLASFILFFAGKQAILCEVEPGAIVTLMSVIHRWVDAFSGIFNELANFKKSNVASAKLLEILERKPAVKLDEGVPLPQRVSGKIEFVDVGFNYPTRDEYAVQHLSFTIQPGETVAIVGESGCGKSTTLQLIQRFYDASEGQILIDGMDIRDISPVSLRSQIAIVPQTPVIFSMNVKDNVRFGRPEASREDVVMATTVANAHDFIRQLSDGYKTRIQQNSLSGGQKQRLCISRAILMDAPLLLLDEATAALDTESERLVQEALGNFRQGKTAILVAHRLATIKNADRILVMDKGKIIESGTHEELMEASGAYAHLVQHQLQ